MSAVAEPRYTYQRPYLYPMQLAAIFNAARYALIEASTKSGKTHGCIVWLTEQALQGQSGYNYWWVAPIISQAKIAYDRLKRALPREIYTSNETNRTITLLNGATIWFKSADNADSLYGEDVYAAVVDEASRVQEDSWYAVRSTLTATQGPVRIIGNVKGRKNWFYRMARRAEAGERNMHYAKITAADAVDAGVLDGDEIQDAKANLPDHIYRELYDAEPSDDGGNPFGLAAIEACIRPLSTQPAVASGWDLAKSMDWTVGVFLDIDGVTCGFERFQRGWEVTTRDIVRINGRVPSLVDSTGVGDPVLEALQAKQYDVFEGFKFTQPSKQQLMEGLSVAIQQGVIGYPEGVIPDELEMFEYEYTRTGVRYTAPEGVHDDCVMGLALAWRRYMTRPVAPASAVSDEPNIREVYGADRNRLVRHGRR